MLIYRDTTERFIEAVRENNLTNILEDNFKSSFGRAANISEINSWQNSLPRVRDLIELADLKNNYIAVEYEIPYNQNRIDCLLFGTGGNGDKNLILLELKQWSKVNALKDEGNFVETYVGGGDRVVPHPSQQAKGYHNYLLGFVEEFDKEPPMQLLSCAYCHNYSEDKDDGLFSPIYKAILEDYPVYTKDDTRKLADKIKSLLYNGDGFEVFNRFMQSPIRPTKKLLENVSKIVENKAVFSLLNEQLVAKNLIWSKVNKSKKSGKSSVVIVHGGPGTGKSLIALNILAEAAKKKMHVSYGCKSKPFTSGIQNLVGQAAQLLVTNLFRYTPSRVEEEQFDLLLIDEAHRIAKTSNFQFTRPEHRTDMPQVDQLVRCAKTSVFFIDDRQNVRSLEIGNSQIIRDAAERYNRRLFEVELNTQFRCMGSNDYLLWLESVLGYTDEKRILQESEVFDFKIFDSPDEIYKLIAEREQQKSNSARMVAGFCWPWSKQLDENGEFVKDIQIGDFAMPWETHGQITRVPKGYVKWFEWAYRTEGVKQVGCIYTAQGFEFDYIGVIIGDDLVYDPESDSLKADISATQDPTLRRGKQNFEIHVKNIYRTLMSRGMLGCYVYFTNKETEAYFRKHIE
ncbi:DNA/RNA helicase domain-containing protein [Desulfopila inferna]|uniref:DNA/RNA helicase domain-containing protein n=1 Tax=Desulfopila inferna TaxID=468528 RepID=UPI0019667A11|nr:DNA/RNA helicase domain-containing protein [Desulfopila inferna]MBM9604113.1 DUF2075 domain-containing protein [Desulfopila inferna]